MCRAAAPGAGARGVRRTNSRACTNSAHTAWVPAMSCHFGEQLALLCFSAQGTAAVHLDPVLSAGANPRSSVERTCLPCCPTCSRPPTMLRACASS